MNNEEEIVLLIITMIFQIFFLAVVKMVAEFKGRNKWDWVIICFFTSFLGLIVLLALKDLKKERLIMEDRKIKENKYFEKRMEGYDIEKRKSVVIDITNENEYFKSCNSELQNNILIELFELDVSFYEQFQEYTKHDQVVNILNELKLKEDEKNKKSREDFFNNSLRQIKDKLS